MAVYSYELGTTAGNMANLEDMSPAVFAPKHGRIEYSRPVTTGDGQVKGLGWLTTSWHWDFMTQAQYTQLKTYCANLSASVFIKTKNNSNTYSTYSAIMLWPTQEPEHDHSKLLDVTIEFRALVVQT